MQKIRIIPTLLTDGKTLVKGEQFNSWRTVGSVPAAARLFSFRNVDELMLLDVKATLENRIVDTVIVADFASVLRVPFSVGGGIDSLEKIAKVLRSGAEKVVIGSAAFQNDKFIGDAANRFGSQALIAAVDVIDFSEGLIGINSGKKEMQVNFSDTVKRFESLGVGEILLQSIKHDGMLMGMNFEAIKVFSELTNLPVIASSGASNHDDFLKAVQAGASAVAAGGVFQFREVTPSTVRNHLTINKIPVRIT